MSTVNRVEVFYFSSDSRAKVMFKKFQESGFDVDSLFLIDAYTIVGDFVLDELEKIAGILTNPIIQCYSINSHQSFALRDFDYALEIGFLPGVTDNVANTVEELLLDLFQKKAEVFTSRIFLIKTNADKKMIFEMAKSVCNELIQRIHVRKKEEFLSEQNWVVPRTSIVGGSNV